MLKSKYTIADARANFETAKQNFVAEDPQSVVELHMCLCYLTEAKQFEAMNQLAEEYGYDIDAFDFLPFPHIPAYRWNMEQAILNRGSGESVYDASMRVVKYIEGQLSENFYRFDIAMRYKYDF